MARRRKVVIPGTVTYVNDSGAAGGGVVGQPPWADAVDGSYVDLVTAAHPDAAISDKAYGFVQPKDLGNMPADWTKVSVFGFVRVRALTTTGVEAPMRVELRSSPANVVSQGTAAQAPGAAFTWHQVSLPIADNFAYDAIVQRIADGTLRVDVVMEPVRPASGSWVYPTVRVPEVYLIVETPGGGAPPCQNFPRDDTLGVGSGQNFPPPKSHQGGRVNFGYW